MGDIENKRKEALEILQTTQNEKLIVLILALANGYSDKLKNKSQL